MKTLLKTPLRLNDLEPYPSDLNPLDLHPLGQNLFDRRHFLAGAAALLMVAPPAAASTADAEAMIRRVTSDVLKIINSGQSEAWMLQQFEGIFYTYADRTLIARSIMGPQWRDASDGERKAYVEALTGYLARKYGKQFRDYIGGTIKVTSSKDYGRKGIVVTSMVSTDRWDDFAVEWQVVKSGNKLVLFDIIVEGVKLLAAERAEVRAVLERKRGSIPELTKVLKTMG